MPDKITLIIQQGDRSFTNEVTEIKVSERNIEEIVKILDNLKIWAEDAVFNFKGLGGLQRQQKHPYYIKKYGLDKPKE